MLEMFLTQNGKEIGNEDSNGTYSAMAASTTTNDVISDGTHLSISTLVYGTIRSQYSTSWISISLYGSLDRLFCCVAWQ